MSHARSAGRGLLPVPQGQALWSEVCWRGVTLLSLGREALKQCEGHPRASHFPPACSSKVQRPLGLPGRLPSLPAHRGASQECSWTDCDTLYGRESETTKLRKRLRGTLRAEATAGPLAL